jgi:hypothetical protein
MLLAMDFRRQPRVCVRLAEDCEDPQLASRLKSMAADLLAKAEDFEDLRAVRFEDSKKLDAA